MNQYQQGQGQAPAGQDDGVGARIANVRKNYPEMALTETGVVLSSVGDVMALAIILHSSGFLPKGFDTPEKAAVVILKGRRLGLDPFVSLDGMAPINGKPMIFGDLAVGLCQDRGDVDTIEHWWELGEQVMKRRPVYRSKADWPDELRSVVKVTLKDGRSCEESCTVADIKNAKVTSWQGAYGARDRQKVSIPLWEKEGPWQDWPDRMMMWRPQSWALRRLCAPVLLGLGIVEEMEAAEGAREPDYEVKGTPAPKSIDDLAPKATPPSSDSSPSCEAKKGEPAPQAAAANPAPAVEPDPEPSAGPPPKMDGPLPTEGQLRALRKVAEAKPAAEFVAAVHAQGFGAGVNQRTKLLEAIGEVGNAEFVGKLIMSLQGNGAPTEEAPAEHAGEAPDVMQGGVPDEGAPITVDQRLTLLQKVDAGDVTKENMRRILAAAKCEEVNDLTATNAAKIIAGLEDGTIWDRLETWEAKR